MRDSKLLFTYLDNFDFEARTINVAPFIGYFFKDNQVVGVKLGYKHTDGHLGNVSFKIDDDEFHSQGIEVERRVV